MEQRTNNASLNDTFQIADAVLGHSIIFNNESQTVQQIKELNNEEVEKMEIKPKYLERCFTPFESRDNMNPGQLGQHKRYR